MVTLNYEKSQTKVRNDLKRKINVRSYSLRVTGKTLALLPVNVHEVYK